LTPRYNKNLMYLGSVAKGLFSCIDMHRFVLCCITKSESIFSAFSFTLE
jgi:hypothetical protein